ncbi:MAG: hypothetical protein E7418_04075 [Ruminococcaceae bacterium]|nr:hypothetical protein [Oscillospiraceae bacterium]
MPLTLLFGEAGTGKSTYEIDLMKNLHEGGKKTLMIVPEQFAHSAENRLLDAISYLSDEIYATSFNRLASKVLHKKGALRNSISSTGKCMLLCKAIMQNKKNLVLYKNASRKIGFTDAMLSFISDCKRSEITPEELLIEDAKDPLFSLKMQELSLLYKSYQSLLEADYTDAEEAVSKLAKMITEDSLFSDWTIFIDEFFCFTKAELSCIRALLVSGASVYVALGAATENARGIFEPVSKTAAQLKRVAQEIPNATCNSVNLSAKHRFANSLELSHFETEYHHYPPTLYKEETHDITLYIAPDPYTEIQVLASSIRREVAENNLHYRDIAILAGDFETYQDLIKTVFPVYDIPVFIDRKRSLLSHSVIVMFFSLFDLISHGIDTESLLCYAKCGYCGLTREEVDTLENFALAGRLKRRDWLDDKRFFTQAKSIFMSQEDYEEVDADKAHELILIRNKVLDPILRLRQNLAKSRLVADRSAAIFNFFEDIHLAEQIEMQMQKLTEAGEHQRSAEYGEIYTLIINLLNELVICLGNEKIGLRRLTDIVSAGLSQCEVSTIPPTADQVFLGDVGRSLTKNVKLLYVIGAVDGTFPPASGPDLLVGDSERIRLEQNGITLGPDSKQLTFHNQYATYKALHISTQKVHISYPVADMEGTGLRPSALIGRLHKIFPALSVTDDIAAPPPPERLIAGKQSGWQYVLEHFDHPDADTEGLLEYFKNDTEYKQRYRAAARYTAYSKQPGRLSRNLAHDLYGHRMRGSVTQFESYAACPFSYFLRYGLKARERKILKVEAPDIGSLMHTLVELASRRIVEDGKQFGALGADYIKKLSNELVDKLFADMFIKHLYEENRLQALIKRLKRQTEKLLTIIGIHIARGQFEPCDFEVAFDENGECKPVVIDLPNGDSVTIIGRIDRIDTLHQNASVYIKIIDYKTGSKSFRLSDVYNGLSLQLAVYLIAATESDRYKNQGTPMPAGMFYFRLRDKNLSAQTTQAEDALLKQFKMSGLVLKDTDIIRAMDTGLQGYSAILPARISTKDQIVEKDGSYATAEQFKRLKAHVRKTVSDIAQQILSGNTAIHPVACKEGLPCRYCVYHPICNFNAESDPHHTAPPLKDDAVWAALEEI